MTRQQMKRNTIFDVASNNFKKIEDLMRNVKTSHRYENKYLQR